MKKLLMALCMMVFFAGVSVAQTNPAKKSGTQTKTEAKKKDTLSSTNTPRKHKMMHQKTHAPKTKTSQ